MIGIVTCTRKQGDAQQMYMSFQGANTRLFEQTGFKSMSAGYNLGTHQALAVPEIDTLVFIHADARSLASYFLWRDIASFVQNPSIGFVGVAGTTKLLPTGVWYQDRMHCCGAITHHNHGMEYVSSFGQGLMNQRVVAVDGVCMIASRHTMSDIAWWSSGFDFYDIDACMQAHSKGLHNYVKNIPLIHESIGVIRESYDLARLKFLEQWGHKLPVSVEEL